MEMANDLFVVQFKIGVEQMSEKEEEGKDHGDDDLDEDDL